jgi:hypothetical protein
MKLIQKTALALSLILTINIGNAAITITGATQSNTNLGLSNGTVLTDGAIFTIGYYSSALSAGSFSSVTSASDFLTGWTQLASSTANLFDLSGLRAASVELATGVNTHVGKNLVMLVGNTDTISGSSQIGVFGNSNWIVPANPTDIPDAYGFDIGDVGTVAYYGSISLGTGAYAPEVVNSANLRSIDIAAIPEPSVASLLALGTVGLVALRVRRKS